jgi:hypothetical protein
LAPDDPIALRAEALCVYWAKLAEADRDVCSFRKKTLGGAAVSANEANRLVTSPAPAFMWPETFTRRGVPIVDHTAKLDVAERSHPFELPYRKAVVPAAYEAPRPPEPIEVRNGTEPILVAPWPRSVLGQLRKTAPKLAERYPWEMPAAWFVLTGVPPWVPPLTATSTGPDLAKNHGTITIRAAHWVLKERLRQHYIEMKAGMKPTPTASPRRLTLFRFINERSPV